MRITYIFFIFLFSCSNNQDSKVNLKDFINQGKKLELTANKSIIDTNYEKINKVKIKNNIIYKSWSQKNYNNSNNILSSFVEINKKNRSISGNYLDIIGYQDKIITIDKKSNLEIFSFNLKKIKRLKIYKRKIYKNYNINFGLAAYKNKILISDNFGNIHCYSLKDFKLIWKQKLGVPFKSNIKIYKNNLYLINSNSKIFSINTISGKINWSFETASKKIQDKGSYQIAIKNNKLFFTNDNAEIYCIDIEKNILKWSLVFESSDYINKPITFISSPILIYGNSLFLSTNYGYIYSMNTENGSVNWSKALKNTNQILINNNYLFFTTNNRLVIMNSINGNLIYNQKVKIDKNDKKIKFVDILIGKNLIYLFSNGGKIISYNLKNLKDYRIIKTSKNYIDYIILYEKLFVLSETLLIKY